MKKSCVTACPVEWPDDRGISGRIRVEWVARSPWNRWSDAHGMGGQMTVESAPRPGQPARRPARHRYRGHRGRAEGVESTSCIDRATQTAQACTAAATVPAYRDPSRTGNTQCACGCQLQRVGEDVSEKLDYTPGVFTVEQHVRGKWACRQCETLIQAPVPAQVIDKGIPTAGLLAHVMVAKFADHLPLYRQEKIFGRAGLVIARSTLAQWGGQTGVQLQPLVDALREAVLAQGVIHADETPVQMLAPGEKKTHRAYVWAYSTTPFADLRAVVYDFSPSRAGEHARNFLGQWSGKLVCDDFAGYKASFEQGITEIGCMAHARRKFFDLHATNKSQLAERVLHSIAGLYEIERQARDMSDEGRWRIRQEKAAPILETLHTWMLAQHDRVPEGSAIAKALDYSLKRWAALTRYLEDGAVPIDNNWVEVRHEVA